MTKLELLISQLCPNGVETYKLKEVCSEFIVPMRDKPKKFDGTIPWCRIEDKEGNYFHRSKSNQCVSETTVSQMNLKIFPVGTVICSCSASIGSYAINTQPLITNQTFIGIVCGDKIFNEYLRYYMETQTKRLVALSNKGTIPYISRKKFEELLIPVPPLPVQEEIVRILDELTEKTDKLILELNAELEKRKKQYEFYLEKLLTSSNDAEFRLLGEMSCFFNGDRGKNYPKTSEMVAEGIPFINAGDINGPDIDYINCNKITKEKYSTMSGAKLKKGDILYCLRGSTGKNGIYDLDEGTVASSLVAIRANQKVNGKFLYYLLNSSLEKTQRIKYDTGAAQPNLSAKNVREYVFPVPSIKEQNRITSILDDLHYYHQNISETLRAEITVQKKRYEHYRDKLLTF